MNQSPDPTRFDVRIFAVMSVYCLLFAQLLADGSWRAAMMGAFVAYAFAALLLATVREGSSDD